MTTESARPPRTLQGDAVIEYAVLDDPVTYSGHSYLFVDGKELGPVPRLAITRGDQDAVLLLHCDDAWGVLGMAAYASVEQAKKRAERIYPGVTARWVTLQAVEGSPGDAADQRCSFCGRPPEQVMKMIEGGHAGARATARICDSCVAECARMLQDE